MSSTPIKICGLTREQDIDAAVEHGVHAIGFVLYPKSPRYVSVKRAAELARRLPAFVNPVLLFVNPSMDELDEALNQVPGAWIQFHGDESPEFCESTARRLNFPWIRAVRISCDASAPPVDLVKYAFDYKSAKALLLDAHVQSYGGSGQVFNWSHITQNVNAHLVLSGGLTPANVASGVAHFRPLARSLSVDVSSGVEVEKGIKDPQKILAFVQAVQSMQK
jgi:phosphoribosylanthranilate isomerase